MTLHPDASSSNGTNGTSGGQPIDCLVVDDEPRLRQVLVNLMRHDGFRCREAGNGAEPVEQLQAQPVTPVMTDIRLPPMHALQPLRHLRPRCPHTPLPPLPPPPAPPTPLPRP